MTTEPIRFADILTTASAVANYMGAHVIDAQHALEAIALLREEKTMDDLGRAASPFLGRVRPEATVDPGLRELVQRWFVRVNSDANFMMPESDVAEMKDELAELAERASED